jgi:hypothetical protein
LITATECATIAIGTVTPAAADLRTTVAHILSHPKTSPYNITPEEARAITDLRKIPDITIFPADKGRATVVLDT